MCWHTIYIRIWNLQKNGIRYASLDELYHSDIISLHCPLTKETEYLINEDSIAK